MPTTKNIIIFTGIGLVMVLVYIFLIKGDDPSASLVSAVPGQIVDAPGGDVAGGVAVGQEFLVILLNVKNIRLDDTIFSNPAFMSLRDSSIVLIPDGNEGRPNPFAPIGVDIVPALPTPPANPSAEPSTSTPPTSTPPADSGATDTN